MREKIIAIVFCLIITGISGATTFNMAMGIFQPDRMKTSVVLGHELEQEHNGIEKENAFVQYFLDNLAGKKQGAKMATEISRKTSGMTYIESSQVLLGKEDWLFYKSVVDSDEIGDFESLEYYDEDQLEHIKNKLEKEAKRIQDFGCDFVLMTIPNKSNMYPEYMPDTYTKYSDKSRTDLMMEFLQNNTNLNVVNAKEELLKYKKNYQLYYSNDTHFNAFGCFIGTQILKNAIDGNPDEFYKMEFTMVDDHYVGDLAVLCGMTDVFDNELKYKMDMSRIDKSKFSDKRVLMVGDSFAKVMNPYLKKYFAKVKIVDCFQFNQKVLEEYKPDVVVWESVERYTDRFSWVNLFDD